MNIGRNSFTEKMTLEDLKSTGTIHWNKFEPPLADSTGVSTLASVLNAGSDANNVGITNLASLEVGTIDAASVQSAVTKGTVGTKNVFTHCDFTAASNTFPSSIDDDTLADVMDRSSAAAPDNKASVGTNDLNMNSQIISNATSVGMQDCLVGNRIVFTEAEGTTLVGSGLAGHPTIASNFNFRDGTNNTFPPDVLGDLAQTMTLGNQVSTDLNMETADGNKKDILNAKTVGAITVGAQTIAASSSIASAVITSNGDVNINAAVTNNAILDFTGSAHPGGVSAIAIETNTGTSTGDPFVDVVYTLTSADNGTKYTYSGSGTGLTFTLTTNSSGFNSVTSSAVALDGNGIDFSTDETLTITEAQMRLITSIGVSITNTVVLKLTANLGLTRIEGDGTLTLGEPNRTICTNLDLSDASNVGATTAHNPFQALLMYDPLTEGSKTWDDMEAAVFGSLIFLPYTPVGLFETPTVMVPVHFKMCFYIEDIDENNVLAGLFRQTETSPGSDSWTPYFNPGNGLITGSIQHGNQYVQHGGNGLQNHGHVTIYGYIQDLVVGTNYRFFPCIRTSTNTNPGNVTCKWGLRNSSEPWSPVVVEINTVPKIFKIL